MSTRSLAFFLHHLLAGELAPIGPVSDRTTLNRLIEQPAPQIQALLGAQMDALLARWPGSGYLRPQAIPSATLWVAVALNNLAWAADRPDPRLLTVTLRLAQALPPAVDLAAALAYHSVLQHLPRSTTPADWRPVARQLVACSPLTALWLPELNTPFAWDLARDLLHHPPVQVALRNHWLTLLPAAVAAPRILPMACAEANRELGRVLTALLDRDNGWHPFVLAFYEADCAMQRRGCPERPEWPLITQLGAARISTDPLQRRRAEHLLSRYRPLLSLMHNPAGLSPYVHLDVRFLTLIADLLPAKRLEMRRVSREEGKG